MSNSDRAVKLNGMNIGRLTIRDSSLSRADFDLCSWKNEFSEFPSITIDKAESLNVVDCKIHSLYFERVAVGRDEFYGANGPVRIFGFEQTLKPGDEDKTAEFVKP